MDTTISKRKTAMVLHKIEESLGGYIFENQNAIICQSNSFDDLRIQDAVERAYLDDIFKMVIKATKDTPEETSIKRLYQLSHDLNLFEIRNAIAHPNRPFLDVYWYRVAAIAADPSFESLGIKDIKAVLYSAEKGSIEDPPEGWEKKFTWDIPNDLPAKFESDVTGLIGRNKALAELKEKLSSPRNNTVAIIAPGGYGKTALALDLLKDIVTTPEPTKWIDAVSYITLKTETWENDGFVKLNAASEIKEIEKLIANQLGQIFDQYIDDIDQAIDEFSNKRIIICIDNLETILRDNEALFDLFVDKLPRDWKVLVTSRVVITNAFIYTLSELKDAAAVQLARIYNRNKGGDELSQEKYTKIAKDCYCNPLAIKMTIDLYLNGKEIPDSINEAKHNIAYFSFNNLISSLSDNALKVLELIFIEAKTNRKLICEILEFSIDESAAAVNELSRTSLINRVSVQDRESYDINGSIKDLLIINPKCMEIRSEIQGRLSRQQTASLEIDIQQKASNLPEWHFQYIPPNAEPGLKILLKEFSKIRFIKNTNNKKVSDVYLHFKKSEDHYKDNYLFVRAYAKLLSSMQLKSEAKKYYEKALSLNPEDMVTKYLSARFYFENSDYDDSLKIYSDLVSRIDDAMEESKVDFYDSIYQGFFLSYLYKGEYEPVIEYTKKWKDSLRFRSVFGTYRASAFKRKMENCANSDTQLTLACLNSATKILDDVFRVDGYSQMSCAQGYKVIEEIFYCLNREIYYKNHEDPCNQLLSFCDKHLVDIIETSRSRSSADTKLIAKNLAEIPLRNNPFKNKIFWKTYGSFVSDSAIDLSELSGPVSIVSIKRIAHNERRVRTNFLFAESNDRKEFFVHFDAGSNCDWSDWLNLQVGDRLAVTEHEEDPDKSAFTVKKFYLINS